MIYHVATFLIMLPIAVWALSYCLALVDEPQKAPALIRLALLAIGIMAILLITTKSLWLPIAAAFISVVCLHVAWFYSVRKWGLGISHLSAAPTRTESEELQAMAAPPTLSEVNEP